MRLCSASGVGRRAAGLGQQVEDAHAVDETIAPRLGHRADDANGVLDGLLGPFLVAVGHLDEIAGLERRQQRLVARLHVAGEID